MTEFAGSIGFIAQRWAKRFDGYWFGAVSARPLACFRIVFTLALIFYFTDRIWYLADFLGDTPARLPALEFTGDRHLQHIQPFYIPPLTDEAALLVAGLFYVIAGALLMGFCSRSAAALLGAWILGTTLADWSASFSLNRSAVIVLFLMACMPIGHTWSLDARMRGRGQPAGTDRIHAWPIRTLQWFLLWWYVSAGMAKVWGDWTFTASHDILWSQLQGWYQNDRSWWAQQHLPKSVFGGLQQIALYFEVFAPIWFVPRRLRPFGMLTGFLLHVLIALLMVKLWLFSGYMLSFYVLFLGDRSAKADPPAAGTDVTVK
jgi:hypothetical protein